MHSCDISDAANQSAATAVDTDIATCAIVKVMPGVKDEQWHEVILHTRQAYVLKVISHP